MNTASADDIDALLPQTQCRQCGYAGCRPYAEALAAGRAGINQCPPGGESTIRELAALTGRPFVALGPEYGVHKPGMVAVIDEAACIGCTLCIRACPVDAIAGAVRLMHTVIGTECTGCELCIPPCPVDCIVMVQEAAPTGKARAALARQRYLARNERLRRERTDRAARHAGQRDESAERRKRETIERVTQRARERLRSRS